MQKEKELTKSPVTHKPLHYAGQSLDKQIEEMIQNKLITVFVAITGFFIASLNDWIYYYFQKIPNPFLTTIAFLVVLGWGIYTFFKLKKELAHIKQGRDGEKEVGYILDELRELGVKVYHDVLGKDFNLDHILVGKQGIFVIETKTYSKPLKGKCEIVYDGEKLSYKSYNGTYESDKPIIQAKAGAQWLKNKLKDSTGRDFNVQPIVVFPGWFTVSKVSQRDIWILNPKGLSQFIQNREPELLSEDVMLIKDRIEIYIRNL